jgi:hypothetical protein
MHVEPVEITTTFYVSLLQSEKFELCFVINIELVSFNCFKTNEQLFLNWLFFVACICFKVLALPVTFLLRSLLTCTYFLLYH